VTDLYTLLDDTTTHLKNKNNVVDVIGQLCHGLNNTRAGLSEEDWKAARTMCLSHPLRELVHQDPFTLRAFEKPRGYAGDAVMMDYMYSGTPPSEPTSMGSHIFRGTTRQSNGSSVIERRNYMAQLIDLVAYQNTSPRILSVACGHLREAGYSEALRSGAVEALYALDQDRESLEIIERNKPGRANVITVNSSVKQLLDRKIIFNNLDLIYAPGLYDYLNESMAKSLTETLFEMLAPDGKLVLLNFTPDSHGRGYMEAFMDWFLIYRDEATLRACASGIDGERISDITLFRDRHKNIVYLEIVKEH
jgi:hypothetical protein